MVGESEKTRNVVAKKALTAYDAKTNPEAQMVAHMQEELDKKGEEARDEADAEAAARSPLIAHIERALGEKEDAAQ